MSLLPYLRGMARKALPLHLPDNDLRSLTTLPRGGTPPARTQTRAGVLDLLRRGQHPSRIAEALSVSSATAFNLKRRYRHDGLAAALFDRPRSGKPPSLDGAQRAKLTAVACSPAPPGHARWTLRLLSTRPSNSALSRAARPTRAKGFPKNRAEAALAKAVGQRRDHGRIPGADGRGLTSLSLAV